MGSCITLNMYLLTGAQVSVQVILVQDFVDMMGKILEIDLQWSKCHMFLLAMHHSLNSTMWYTILVVHDNFV